MNKIIKCCVIIFFSLQISCGGISIIEHQDAETLNRGKFSVLTSASGGPEEWSKKPRDRFVKAIAPAILEPRLSYGISDRLNVGASLWSGYAAPVLLSKVVLGANIKSCDFGLRGMLKYRVTPDNSKMQMSLLLNYTNYFLFYSERTDKLASGISPGLIISKRSSQTSVMYGIIKYNIFNIDHDYGEGGEGSNPNNFPSFHIGYSENIKKNKGFAELVYSYVNNPLSIGHTGHVFSISVGYMWKL